MTAAVLNKNLNFHLDYFNKNLHWKSMCDFEQHWA